MKNYMQGKFVFLSEKILYPSKFLKSKCVSVNLILLVEDGGKYRPFINSLIIG